MKLTISILVLGLTILISGNKARAWTADLAHMDPEMEGAEYRALLDKQSQELGVLEFGPLDPAMRAGERNLNWLRAINDKRPAGQKISFSSKETQVGIPMTEPRKNNAEIVLGKYADLKRDLPESMRKVIFDGGEITSELPVDQAAYIEWGRKVDMMYQSASRWLLQAPFLWSYESRRYMDIRGYAFLLMESDLDNKLAHWSNLDATEKTRLTQLLIGLCVNTRGNPVTCQGEFDAGADRADVATNFYKKYFARSKQVYDGFFVLQNPRREAVWNSKNPNLFVLPFQDPGSDAVRSFLLDNIQDEWRFENWALNLRMDTSGSSYPEVVFEAGATPHVNGLGGGTITMDANQPLDQYNVQWTIRHEFGHVLGLPDCYVEFYDSTEKVMINYQIDTDNLMCSRRGHLKATHIEQLKKNYYKN